jgi:hypothetical protein
MKDGISEGRSAGAAARAEAGVGACMSGIGLGLPGSAAEARLRAGMKESEPVVQSGFSVASTAAADCLDGRVKVGVIQ